jgi:hypothetical protein
MTWTTPKVIAVVAAASFLSAVGTALLMRQHGTVPSGPMAQAMATPPQRGLTLRQFPAPDPQALEDLESKVKDRQNTIETVNEITINLKPYVNCKLTDPLADEAAEDQHNLAELPVGHHTYGGVPFQVDGLIQIIGGSIKNGVKLWPMEVPEIAVGHSCKKLHLLHGAFNIAGPAGHPHYAKLVLHYADGSQAELTFIGGTHALRCVDAAIPQRFELLETPQSELAWIGSNPYLKKNNPTAMLHLYRTTFDNPQPEVAITTIDYVSNMGNPGPFLAGLTID